MIDTPTPILNALRGAGDTKPIIPYVNPATGEQFGAVVTATAEHMIPVLCELGGKDPMIVLDDADISAAARWGVFGKNQ